MLLIYEIGIIIWLMIGTMTDFKYKKISKIYAYLSVVLGIIIGILQANGEWQGYIIGGCFGFLFFLLAKITKEQIGYGDAFVLTGLGFAVGLETLINLLSCSFLLLFFVSIFMLIFRKANRKTRVAYIPFLLVGFCLTVF